MVTGDGTEAATAVATALCRRAGNHAIRLDIAGRLQPEFDYLVKINLIPAISSTVARQSEITRTAKRLLPKCDPMMPPIIAAAARMKPSEGIVRTFVK